MQFHDQEITALIHEETIRQNGTLNLIASENYASQEVLDACGSVLSNKYAEGYPGKRYYAGCSVIDAIENLAIARCTKLFGAEHANVQPHSGSQANMAVYFAALKPGDTMLGMGLREGGHLSHGHAANFSGKLFKQISYAVDSQTELLDYEHILALAQQYKPRLIIAGASAYSKIIDFEKFAHIAASVGALLLADIAHIAGLVATGLHPSPFPHADFVTATTHKTLRGPRGGIVMCKKEYADALDHAIMPGMQGGPLMNIIAAKAVCFAHAMQPEFAMYQQQVIKNAHALANSLQQRGYRIVSGGTDNHLFVIDLSDKNISGLAAQNALESAGITVSKSCIPFDPASPWITSGIRVGTPAITTRGMKEYEMGIIAHLIDNVLQQPTNRATLHEVQEIVGQLCGKYPIRKQA